MLSSSAHVDFVWPGGNNNGDKFAKNAIVQMNFSEPINILSINQNNVTSTAQSGTLITGNLKISNQYRTIEFLSNMSCGGEVEVNSCGEKIFCLPGDDTINTIITSGIIGQPLSGISDAAGNILDGDGDGIEEGSDGGDDYEWTFETNDELNITAPEITEVNPINNLPNVQTNPAPRVSATFNKTISPSSVSTNNFYIYDNTTCVDLGEDNTELDEGYKYNVMDRDIPSQNDGCFPIYTTKVSDSSTKCNIELYSPYLGQSKNYRPRLTSQIKDSYGNCFNSAVGPGGTGQQ